MRRAKVEPKSRPTNTHWATSHRAKERGIATEGGGDATLIRLVPKGHLLEKVTGRDSLPVAPSGSYRACMVINIRLAECLLACKGST
jgi:hypothetical protein